MKNMLYSNRSDELFKEITSHKFEYRVKGKRYADTIEKIGTLFDKSNEAFASIATSREIIEKKKRNMKVDQISDVIMGKMSRQEIEKMNLKKDNERKKSVEKPYPGPGNRFQRNNKSLFQLEKQFNDADKRAEQRKRTIDLKSSKELIERLKKDSVISSIPFMPTNEDIGENGKLKIESNKNGQKFNLTKLSLWNKDLGLSYKPSKFAIHSARNSIVVGNQGKSYTRNSTLKDFNSNGSRTKSLYIDHKNMHDRNGTHEEKDSNDVSVESMDGPSFGLKTSINNKGALNSEPEIEISTKRNTITENNPSTSRKSMRKKKFEIVSKSRHESSIKKLQDPREDSQVTSTLDDYLNQPCDTNSSIQDTALSKEKQTISSHSHSYKSRIREAKSIINSKEFGSRELNNFFKDRIKILENEEENYSNSDENEDDDGVPIDKNTSSPYKNTMKTPSLSLAKDQQDSKPFNKKISPNRQITINTKIDYFDPNKGLSIGYSHERLRTIETDENKEKAKQLNSNFDVDEIVRSPGHKDSIKKSYTIISPTSRIKNRLSFKRNSTILNSPNLKRYSTTVFHSPGRVREMRKKDSFVFSPLRLTTKLSFKQYSTVENVMLSPFNEILYEASKMASKRKKIKKNSLNKRKSLMILPSGNLKIESAEIINEKEDLVPGFKKPNLTELLKSPVKIKTNAALNTYLIRDHNVGDHISGIASSKKKFDIASKFYESKAENQRKALQKKIDQQQKEDNIIKEKNEEKDEEADNYPTEFKTLEEFQRNKEIHLTKRVKNDTVQMMELLENLDQDYEEVKTDNIVSLNKIVNYENLKRIIALKNIKKFKIDSNSNYLGVTDINKFKEKLKETDYLTTKALHKLGPPKYIKTRFKLSTTKKYNIFGGNYFGKSRKESQIEAI